jgi:hypothetical protein
VYLRCNRPRQAKSIIVGGGANDYRESELELVIECEQTYTSGRGGVVAFYGCRLAPDFR